MKPRARVATITALAIVTMAVGCGDDGSGSSPDGGDVNKVTFVKEAEAECAKRRKTLLDKAGIYVKTSGVEKLPEDLRLARTVKAVVAPMIEEELEAVRALPAPPGDKQRIEALLAAQQAGVNEVKKLRRVSSFEEVQSYFREAAKGLRKYGLDACTYG